MTKLKQKDLYFGISCDSLDSDKGKDNETDRVNIDKGKPERKRSLEDEILEDNWEDVSETDASLKELKNSYKKLSKLTSDTFIKGEEERFHGFEFHDNYLIKKTTYIKYDYYQ